MDERIACAPVSKSVSHSFSQSVSQAGRQAGRQSVSQTGRQAGRQSGRQAVSHTVEALNVPTILRVTNTWRFESFRIKELNKCADPEIRRSA
eukprot:2538990-Pyramimonas_sp.AAC.1